MCQTKHEPLQVILGVRTAALVLIARKSFPLASWSSKTRRHLTIFRQSRPDLSDEPMHPMRRAFQTRIRAAETPTISARLPVPDELNAAIRADWGARSTR